MMELEINLIRHIRVVSFRRRIMFFGMIFYIIFCVLFLVILCYKISDEIVKMSRYYKKALSSGVSKSGFTEAEARAKILRYIGIFETIDSVLSKRVNLSSLLSRFSAALPSGAYIDNFRLDADKQGLNFEVIMPLSKAGDSFNTGDLVFVWKQDALLMSIIDSIDSSASSRRKDGEEAYWVSEFSCRFSKKDQ